MEKPVQLLVVDDSPETHELADLLFGTSCVLHAYNGREGLDLLPHHPGIDAILLDLRMPIVDGFAFLERVRDHRLYQSLPVCVFSSNKEDATRALSLGARDFIDKPADYQELKLRLQNLVDSKRRVEAAHRAKADFLAVVSHELRTPMNGILGMAQAIRDGALSPDQARYLDILEQSSTRMASLVDNVLRFLESENPLHNLPRLPFSPRVLVQAAVDRRADDAMRNDVSLEVLVGPGVPGSVEGLPDKVSLVLDQLVANAVKFSPGGKVVVSVLADPGVPGRLVFSVRDTGIGFPEGWKQKIFDPFTQVDGSETRRFGGLGIGLSIAGRTVQMLGGEILVESEPGRGSLFQFTLDLPVPSGVDHP